MNMNYFTIFDVIIGLLGIYLVFVSIRSYKKGIVDPMMATAEELARCSDEAGFSKYLMPKVGIFGGFCVIFGIQGLLSDAALVSFPKAVNVTFLIAFVVVWLVFSFFIHKAKKQYIH